MAVTAEMLRELVGRQNSAVVAAMVEPLNTAMTVAEINTPARVAAFLAQIAHESGGFKYLHEIWGPTAQQKRYEPPSVLARRLGNTDPGDGYKYRGRGFIQITGRNNYRWMGQLIGIDLENEPKLAAGIPTACRIAAEFWKQAGCNELADAGDFEAITRRINGGLNGLEERKYYYEKAQWLMAGATAPTNNVTAGGPAGSIAG